MERYVYIAGATVLMVLAAIVFGVLRARSGQQPKWLRWLLVWRALFSQQDRLQGEAARRSAKRIRGGLIIMALLIVFAVLCTGGPKNPPM
jgi:hypothetical protein